MANKFLWSKLWLISLLVSFDAKSNSSFVIIFCYSFYDAWAPSISIVFKHLNMITESYVLTVIHDSWSWFVSLTKFISFNSDQTWNNARSTTKLIDRYSWTWSQLSKTVNVKFLPKMPNCFRSRWLTACQVQSNRLIR